MMAILLVSIVAGLAITFNYTNNIAYAQSNSPDTLFVGDGGDNTIKVVDINAGSGKVLIPMTDKAKDYSIKGPQGIVLNGGTLLVVNQNVNTGKNGEIVKFDSTTGKFAGFFIKNNNKDAPFAPRGMVLSPDKAFLYVASFEGSDSKKSLFTPGSILKYNLDTGALVASFKPTADDTFSDEFHPRGLVFGPDGKLYVSVFEPTHLDRGYILRLNAENGDFDDEFVLTNANLHRPDGLVFAPDGKLGVTSFRANADDIDRLLAFDLTTNDVKEIKLDKIDEPRAFAQAILFGPGGDLFVPITATGELRRYNADGTPDVDHPPITTAGLKGPLYLTFQATNPSTLDYNP